MHKEGVRLKLKRDFSLSHLSPQIIMDQQTTIMIASHAGCLLLLKQYMVASFPGSTHSSPFGMEECGCLVPRLHPLFSLWNGGEWLEPGDEAKYMANSMFHLHAVLKDVQYNTHCVVMYGILNFISMNNINLSFIGRALNGFLNTGQGGTVYLGVTDDGMVKGIYLTQAQVSLDSLSVLFFLKKPFCTLVRSLLPGLLVVILHSFHCVVLLYVNDSRKFALLMHTSNSL